MPAMPRRTVLRLLLTGNLAALFGTLFYPILRYLVPPAEANAAGGDALAAMVGEMKPNSGKTFRFGSKPALLVRLANGEYRSMSAECTHLGCTVQYKPETQQVWCPCHNGCYDVNGRNVSGPPPRPLSPFDVQVRGQEIYVSQKQDG